MRFDLHTHSTASDGALSPAALVRRAAERGLQGIALTDHDTVAGVAEASAEAARLGLELIPGIELSVQVGQKDIHVLGYWIDHESDALREILAELVAMRGRRVEGMVRRLRGLGIRLELDAVLAEAGGGAPGRPHVARALLKAGAVDSIEEAFDLYIGNDGPAYVPKSLMDADRGFALLKQHGAVAVMAHPGLSDYEALLPGFLARGLAGLEVEHPKHGSALRAVLAGRCRELDLVPTAGSDFHQPGGAGAELGACALSGEGLARLRARRPRAAA